MNVKIIMNKKNKKNKKIKKMLKIEISNNFNLL